RAELGLPDRRLRHAHAHDRGAGAATGGPSQGAPRMIERHGLSRRQFLVLSAACGASLVARSSIPSWLSIPDRSTPAERLARLLPPRPSPRVPGAVRRTDAPSPGAPR